MKEKFYTTKAIAETLDMRLLISIQALVSSMGSKADYLQIFRIEGNKLIHSQEVPETNHEYRLNKNTVIVKSLP